MDTSREPTLTHSHRPLPKRPNRASKQPSQTSETSRVLHPPIQPLQNQSPALRQKPQLAATQHHQSPPIRGDPVISVGVIAAKNATYVLPPLLGETVALGCAGIGIRTAWIAGYKNRAFPTSIARYHTVHPVDKNRPAGFTHQTNAELPWTDNWSFESGYSSWSIGSDASVAPCGHRVPTRGSLGSQGLPTVKYE